MRIKLIAPHESADGGVASGDAYKVQKVGLPLLAALTPPGHDVRIVDEAFAPDDPDEPVDLVGISVMTELARRAYRIAARYRQRGVPVVLGGIHPTVMPAEALEHADAVAVGEAEDTWPALVNDADDGRLQRLYAPAAPAAVVGRPPPRRDLYPRPSSRGYTPPAVGVEAARGCPFDCEFCSIGSTMGRSYRVKPVREVVAELGAIDSPNVFFVDDALGLDRRTTKTLLREMMSLGLRWVGQGNVSLAEDVELLRLMRRSGCLGLLVGFESAQEGAGALRKSASLRIGYAEAMRRFHGEGIAVLGAFVFGFDHQDRDAFDRTIEFILDSRIDCVQARLLLPLPGTRLYQRLLDEGRLFDPTWWLHGHTNDTLLFRPRRMTEDELLDGLARLNRVVYSLPGMARRLFGIPPWRRSAAGMGVCLAVNVATRRRYWKGFDVPQPFRGSKSPGPERARPAPHRS